MGKGDAEFLFTTDGDNKLSLFLWSAGGISAYLGQRWYAGSFSTGTWYHLTATYDGSNSASGIKLYVDGSVVTLSDASVGSYLGMATGGSLLIGKWSYNDSALDGIVDEVAIFDSELSASDVAAIYNSGSPADLTSLSPVGWWRMGDGTEDGSGTTIYDMSSNSNNGTLTNGPTYSTSTP